MYRDADKLSGHMRDFRAESFTSLEGAFGKPRALQPDSQTQTHRPKKNPMFASNPDLNNSNKLH
jgi:hypothetical protein